MSTESLSSLAQPSPVAPAALRIKINSWTLTGRCCTTADPSPNLFPLSRSFTPSWIGNVQWLHPLYHLICFLIWSWAAMWLIKGRCELSSSQRSPCIQTNMLIHCLFACIYLPLLLPTISKYIHSLPILPPPIYTFFLLSFYDRFILSLKIFLLQLIFYSRLK